MSTENLHYKYLKLTNGENIICTTDNDCSKLRKSKTISVVDPVILTPIRYPRGTSIIEGYVFQPWIKFVTETVFEIPVDTIIVASDVEEKLKESYLNFLIGEKEEAETDEIEELTSSVEKQKFIEILKSLGKSDREDDESSEEEIKRFTPSGHSIH